MEPRRVEPRRVGDPAGWSPEGWSPEGWAQYFALFFPPAGKFVLFFPLWVFFHTTAREPKRAHLSAPTLQTPPTVLGKGGPGEGRSWGRVVLGKGGPWGRAVLGVSWGSRGGLRGGRKTLCFKGGFKPTPHGFTLVSRPFPPVKGGGSNQTSFGLNPFRTPSESTIVTNWNGDAWSVCDLNPPPPKKCQSEPPPQMSMTLDLPPMSRTTQGGGGGRKCQSGRGVRRDKNVGRPQKNVSLRGGRR